MSEQKSRCFSLVIYPSEDKTHQKALDYIVNNYQYAYINHNKDIEKDTGEIKKEHTHIIIYFDNARYKNSIAKELEITDNYIQKCDFIAYTKYLIHKNNKDKYQYSIGEIKTNMEEKIINAIEYTSKTEQILNIIKDNNIQDFRELVYYAKENDFMKEIVKNAYFYKQLMRY